jgi:lipopolysaccharide/colanic/teichoic acid biosynthesis glycosyltransferase
MLTFFCYKLRETDEQLSRSGRLLNRMFGRIIQNRLAFVGLIILAVILIIITLYIKFRKSS